LPLLALKVAEGTSGLKAPSSQESSDDCLFTVTLLLLNEVLMIASLLESQ